MKPIFLSLEDVLELHRDQVRNYGGSPGVRDLAQLISAIEMPKAAFASQFLREALYETSAAYLFLIVRNHPFVDGNRRTGLAASIAFLRLNGLEVTADQNALANMVLEVAYGHLYKPKQSG